MAYFSNGSEGEDYHATYCARCVHDADPKGCAVWGAHLFSNYDECNNRNSILHVLIPRTANGLGNEQCRLFVADRPSDVG